MECLHILIFLANQPESSYISTDLEVEAQVTPYCTLAINSNVSCTNCTFLSTLHLYKRYLSITTSTLKGVL